MTAERMWPGGPLRQFSRTRPKHGKWVSYKSADLDGFAGNYVCDSCHEVSRMGVYAVAGRPGEPKGWLCPGCRDAAKVRQPQPIGLARYREQCAEVQL